MNLFFLNQVKRICASLYADQHVNKILLEVCQMLFAAHRRCGTEEAVLDGCTASGRAYRRTHMNNPFSVWAGETLGNYRWLVDFAICLAEEYSFRFPEKNKPHACLYVAKRFKKIEPRKLVEENVLTTTPRPTCKDTAAIIALHGKALLSGGGDDSEALSHMTKHDRAVMNAYRMGYAKKLASFGKKPAKSDEKAKARALARVAPMAKYTRRAPPAWLDPKVYTFRKHAVGAKKKAALASHK